MTVAVDHVLWAATDLEDGVGSLHDRTGLAAVPGGSHPGWGTRNALVGLGDTYLEVLATDPDQDGGWLADEVRSLDGPVVSRWALRTDDLDGLVARVRSAGLRTDPVAMSRTTPAGETLRWRIAFLEGHGLGRAVPFVIDWLDTPHPTTSLPPQGSLVEVAIGHPSPGALRDVLDVLGVTPVVQPAPTASLRVTLDSPRGRVTL